MRSFSKNNNYSRIKVAELFDSYDRYVSTVFMHEVERNKEYFQKSMDFFHLEIYKRIDFIYKLACRLENTDFPIIDKTHALVKRFHPEVLRVYVDNDRLFVDARNKYYRPMLMLEESWQQKKRYKESMYLDTLQKHHLIRAKVYEIFKYHCMFESDNYDDISDFIRERYNVLDYHDPQKTWIQEDKKRKADRERRLIKALEINEALFGSSDKRTPHEWTDPQASPNSSNDS